MKRNSIVKKIEASTKIDIPEAHKEIVRNRIQKMEENPESCLSWEDIDRKLKL